MNTFKQFFSETKHLPKVLQGYSRQGNIENSLKARLEDSFIWLPRPTPILKVVSPEARGRLLSPDMHAFVYGYRPIKNLPAKSKQIALEAGLYDIQGDPCFAIVRINRKDKNLWGYYLWLPFFLVPNNPNSMHQDHTMHNGKYGFNMETYLNFPFGLNGGDIRTSWHLNQFRDLINNTPATLKLIDDYVTSINSGPRGYVDFFLHHPALKHLTNNEKYKITVTKALARAGYLSPTDVDDKTMVDLL